MKKNYFFTLLLTLFCSTILLGQGKETFDKSSITTSYADGSFVGENSITWSYIASRDANGDNNNSGISLPALMLRRSSDDSKVTSSTISGGIGDFSVKLYKGFTGGGNRQVELFVNGVSKGTSTPFDDFNEHVFTVSGINITGDVVIELKNITSKQVIVDDITWTAPSTEPFLSISSPTESTVYKTTMVDVTINVSNFTVSADNGSGVSDNSGDGYIKASLETIGGSTEITNFYTTTLPSIEVVPGSSYTLTLELVDNSGAALSPAISESVSFSADFGCDLSLEEIATTCDTETAGTDTYSATIAFTGGNTGATYTITAPSGVVVGGDNPDTVETGTITFSNISEGVDADITIVGNSQSTCDLSRTLSSPTCVPAATCPAVGAIIITEIMQNPSFVGDNDGEYFEVYNTTSSSIDLLGWILKDTSSSSEIHTIASSVVVPANGYAVLGVKSDVSINGGVTVNYEYGAGYFLGNGADDIVLECGGTAIDQVDWDGGTEFPDPNGKSMELATNKYSATDNDDGANWAEATSEIVSGGDLGTPGIANDFVLSLERNAILGFATYPNPITNHQFTVTSSNSSKKEIAIYNLLGKQVLLTTINGTKATIDVANVTAGIYILKVTENDKIATRKLVIK
ncbi:T9SS type A sorting domain-containing protein [Polaribacter sp.]|uniref:T9SS type A sorting domain-containing protein n=1 Tax=Polaribacter sp. TaxID=1920175 RepID=UPI003F6D503E